MFSEVARCEQSHIDVVSNDRIFDLFIIANAAGYSFENGTSFSELRSIAQEHTSSFKKNCDNIIEEFKNITKGDTYYSHSMNDILADSSDANDKHRKQLLDDILNRFNSCADIDKLKQRLKLKIDAYHGYYESRAKKAIVFTFNTLRISKSDYPKRIVIVPNPFDSHYRGYNVSTKNAFYIIVGAGQNSNNLDTVIHEMIHFFVDRHVNSIKDSQLDELKGEYDKIKSQNQTIRDGYPNVRVYLAENIVTALETHVTSKLYHKEPLEFLSGYKRQLFVYAMPFLTFMKVYPFKIFAK